MKDLDINGYKFRIIEQGNGDPLIFIHGSVSDYRTWQIPQTELSKHFHTFSFSRRYHWPNRQIVDDEDYAMYQHMDDLVKLIELLGVVPAHLVGHSYGAFICLLVALNAPELIRTLVIAEPPAITLFVSDPPKPHEILKLLIIRPRAALSLLKFGARAIAPATRAIKNGKRDKAIEIFGNATLGENTFSDLSAERFEQVRQNLIEGEFLGSGYPPLNVNALSRIKIPTLLLSGQNSPLLFHIIIDRLKEILSDASWKEISGASHIMHEDNSSDYNKAVLTFLKNTSEY